MTEPATPPRDSAAEAAAAPRDAEATGPATSVLRRARASVFLLFFINAAAYANVVPRLPEIRDDIGLSNTSLGTAIAAMPVGALLAGLPAGVLIAKIGSGRLSVFCGFGFAVVLPMFGLASAWWMLAGCLFLTGVLDAVMDAAMNTHGMRVQDGYKRSILSSFHALWSIGAVVGGLLSTTLAGLHTPLPVHLVGTGVMLAVLTLTAWPLLLPEAGEDAQRNAGPGEDGSEAGGSGKGAARAAMNAALPALLMLGAVLVMSSVVEDTPASWGSALLQDDFATSAVVGGFAYVGFQIAMTVARFAGDRVIDRFGRVAVARAGGLLIAVPLGVALLTDSVPFVIAGFACAGLGAASLFPAAMHAAGKIPGVRSGDGIAVVSWLARVGFLAAPPLVGVVGDHVSLRAGVSVMVLAGLVTVALATALRPGDRQQAEEAGKRAEEPAIAD